MLIGFDVSRAQIPNRAGPENYTYNLIKGFLRVDKESSYRLYCRGQLDFDLPSSTSPVACPPVPGVDRWGELSGGRTSTNYELRIINWPKLWTQAGLALECLLNPPDILFVPAHTIPLIKRPSLKTMV